MFKSIKRARRRTRVLTEFHKLYGLHLGHIGDEIGSDKLDELLNSVCDRGPLNPTEGAENIAKALQESFGIDVPGRAVRAQIQKALDSD